ncbi:MAG: histidine phosphatase family protein [Pseudomonadota bacterium]
MPRLFIVRHGNTFDRGDTVLRVGGRTDLALSKSGEIQAGALAAHFAGMTSQATRIIAGPLRRTLQTARIIAGGLGVSEVEVDERLREIDYGPDEGKPEDDVISRIGAQALEAWESSRVIPQGWSVDPGALVALWEDTVTAASASDGDTLVVTSNGIARFALGVVTARGEVPLKLRTGAYGTIDLINGQAKLIDWDKRP